MSALYQSAFDIKKAEWKEKLDPLWKKQWNTNFPDDTTLATTLAKIDELIIQRDKLRLSPEQIREAKAKINHYYASVFSRSGFNEAKRMYKQDTYGFYQGLQLNSSKHPDDSKFPNIKGTYKGYNIEYIVFGKDYCKFEVGQTTNPEQYEQTFLRDFNPFRASDYEGHIFYREIFKPDLYPEFSVFNLKSGAKRRTAQDFFENLVIAPQPKQSNLGGRRRKTKKSRKNQSKKSSSRRNRTV